MEVSKIKESSKKVKNLGKTGKTRMFKHRKDAFQEIAEKRMVELLALAEMIFKEDKALANRYVFLARKLATKYKVSFSKEQKMKFCKNCGSFLVQGVNSRLRLSKGNLVIKCMDCNVIRRSKYK